MLVALLAAAVAFVVYCSWRATARERYAATGSPPSSQAVDLSVLVVFLAVLLSSLRCSRPSRSSSLLAIGVLAFVRSLAYFVAAGRVAPDSSSARWTRSRWGVAKR